MQRDEVMPPIELLPCSDWMALKREAAKAMASSQLTLRQESVIRSRIIGSVWRSLWVA